MGGVDLGEQGFVFHQCMGVVVVGDDDHVWVRDLGQGLIRVQAEHAVVGSLGVGFVDFEEVHTRAG